MDDEGNLVAVEDSSGQRSFSQGTPTKRNFSNVSSSSSQQSQHSQSSQMSTPSSFSGSISSGNFSPSESNGLHLHVDFSGANPLIRTKIENSLTMIHVHLETTLKKDQNVSTIINAMLEFGPFLVQIEPAEQNLIIRFFHTETVPVHGHGRELHQE
jgi:hypothetical protein